ncbi:MAG: DUF1553 domain-containing protein, partial [Flavobacteriaceae bacterium]
MKNFFLLLVFLITSCSINIPTEIEVEYTNLPDKIDYNYDVKPILSDRCYQCHGPDQKARKAGLRLDIEEIAFSKLKSGNYAFSSGSTYGSEVAHRILSTDPDVKMPAPESKLSLTNKEKAIILKWIEQGAIWKEHWSFLPIQKTIPPAFDNKKIKNEIDNFIYDKLIKRDLYFSGIATKEKLIRRVYFDLTGLPPSIQEIDAFVADKDPNAYSNIIDKLLDSNENAERLTMDWLDLSRYADSHGLHADGLRIMWPWRDWVIKAFKENMPYDEFVSVQLSGDLRENASKDEKIATAFNRNTPMTAEGGAIDEEWRLNYVFDRTETLGTAFLGLTMMCAKCHDHKFDPISQKDYYQLSGFFNQIRELGMTGDDGDYGPLMLLPDVSQEKKISALDQKIDQKKTKLNLTKEELTEFYKYSNSLSESKVAFSIKKSIIQKARLENIKPFKKKLESFTVVQGTYERSSKFIIDNDLRIVCNVPPKIEKGVDGNAFKLGTGTDAIFLASVPNFEWTDPFSATIWVNTEKRKKGFGQTVMGTTGEKNNFWRGWDLFLDDQNYINFRLISALPGNLVHIKSKDSILKNNWTHLSFSYDGLGKANGLDLYVDGDKIKNEVLVDNLYKSIKPVSSSGIKLEKRELKIGVSNDYSSGDNKIFKGLIDDIIVYNKALTDYEIGLVYNQYDINEKLNFTDSQKKDHLINRDYKITRLKNKIQNLKQIRLNEVSDVIELMVMEEMVNKRKTYAYERGLYSMPTYEVSADVPLKLPTMSEDLPKNRIGLSKWLFDKENPLTSRVTVNRYWQMIFGRGIVNTPGDFGVQGSLPSHPELLNFLSNYLIENNWNIKALLKLMVNSHTYMQSSVPNEKYTEIDPDNIFLSRSNSYRLPAEMIRDNALAASGLMVKNVGGESVRPYQPKGLWREKSNFSIKLLNYKESSGDSLYRRSMYTFIRRTSPPPSMSVFDAPTREVCTVKREITNTPLQALVMLNDPQFFEASRILAERMQKEAPSSIDDSISYGFKLCTSRKP